MGIKYEIVGVTKVRLGQEIALPNTYAIPIVWSDVVGDDLGMLNAHNVDFTIHNGDLFYDFDLQASFRTPLKDNPSYYPVYGSYCQVWAEINGVGTGWIEKPSTKAPFFQTGGTPKVVHQGTMREFSAGDVIRFIAWQNSGYQSRLRTPTTNLLIKCWRKVD